MSITINPTGFFPFTSFPAGSPGTPFYRLLNGRLLAGISLRFLGAYIKEGVKLSRAVKEEIKRNVCRSGASWKRSHYIRGSGHLEGVKARFTTSHTWAWFWFLIFHCWNYIIRKSKKQKKKTVTWNTFTWTLKDRLQNQKRSLMYD